MVIIQKLHATVEWKLTSAQLAAIHRRTITMDIDSRCQLSTVVVIVNYCLDSYSSMTSSVKLKFLLKSYKMYKKCKKRKAALKIALLMVDYLSMCQMCVIFP